MSQWSRWVRCAVVLGIALFVAAPHDPEPGKEGGEKKQKERREVKQKQDREKLAPQHREKMQMMQKASRLANPRAVIGEGADPLQHVQMLFDLSEDQKAEMQELAEQRRQERQRITADLNAKYGEKAEAVLTDAQKQQYQTVKAALERYRDAVREAADGLREVGGQQLWERAGKGYVRGGADLVHCMKLSDEQRKKLHESMGERRKAMEEARKGMKPPTDRQDKEAMKKFYEQHKAMMENYERETEAEVDKLLTPEQREQMQKMKEAVQGFNEKVKQAQKAYHEEMKQAVRPTANAGQ